MGNINEIIHDLKQPLTSIKGFTEMLMNDYKNDLSLEIILRLKDVLDQSLVLENKIEKLSYNNLKTSKKIDLLIVEDHYATLRLLSQFFEKKGYNCKTITNGKEALKFLKSNTPNIILLDILLPDMNGYDICKKIKDNNGLSNIPLYYITAVSELEVKEKTKETGADGYILKPFNFKDFNVILDLL